MDDEKKSSDDFPTAENAHEYEVRVYGEAARLIGCSEDDIREALGAAERPATAGGILDLSRAVALARTREDVEELGASGLIRRRIVGHLAGADGNELAGMLRAIQARRPSHTARDTDTGTDAAEELVE